MSRQADGTDPLGIYMAGFLLNKTPAEACAIAKQQRALAALDGDADGCRWWNQVLTYLAVTGRLASGRHKQTRRKGTSRSAYGERRALMETRDYAKLGQVTWRAEVGLDDGFEPHAKTVAERECPARSKGLAKAFVTRTLQGLRNPPERPGVGRPFYWGAIQRGTYQDSSFDDVDDGRVRDATWEPDHDQDGELVEERAYLGDDGQVVWSTDPEQPKDEDTQREEQP